MTYVHPADNNLKNLHKAMKYNSDGEPVVRTHVDGISLQGDVIVDKVKIQIDTLGNVWDENHPAPVSISSLPSVEISNAVIPVSFPTAGADAFGRQRISEPFTLGDYKHLYGIDPSFIDSLGNGGTITFVKNKACCTMTTTSNSSSFVVHQTKFYHHYMPGKSQVIMSSINFGAATNNVTKRTGYFDDNDGIYFEQAGDGTLSWVIRSFVTGVATEVRKTQSQWNLDTASWMDITKTQLAIIDFQWLGVGRVRVGFAHDGDIIYVHEFLHSNNLPTVYMSNPNLPVRCEIRNTGTTTGGSMDQICSTVFSEGGYVEAGQDWAVSSPTLRALAAGTTLPILAIRLKSAYKTYANRMIVRMGSLNMFSDGENIKWRLIKLPAQSYLTGSTWVNVHDDSGIEYNSTCTAWTDGSELDNGWVGASTQGSQKAGGAPASNTPSSAKKNYIVQNFDSTDSEIYLIVATNLGAQPTNVGVGAQWREIY